MARGLFAAVCRPATLRSDATGKVLDVNGSSSATSDGSSCRRTERNRTGKEERAWHEY
ncbi:hypothetical protein [Lentzea flava]|uniref:Uncharacterized protein n=1 Tax=Lentzea flava TaxID=103732 RepID=A0ABQ2UAM8_9PSEU|nr:hypothetical protein [Lentzea flava]MCP2196766.1 hypothetical protein [Lentzea flava]GGU15665.1 hypothetical protein GCM10010178_04030 [Lentzea flava]